MKTVVFDIYGTLLDETGSLRAECSAVLGDDAGPAFADEWEDRTGVANRETRLGRREWVGSENLRRAVLSELLAERGLPPAGAEFAALAHVAHRYAAFPDAADGLDQLARVTQVIGLTNTDFAAVSEASARAGLRWHTLLSTQLPRPHADHDANAGEFDHHLTSLTDLAEITGG